MSDLLSPRRTHVATALPLADAILLVGAGLPQPLPGGSNQTDPIRAYAEHFYLTGEACAGRRGRVDPRNGAATGWVSFVPEVTEGERVRAGRTQTPGTPLAALAAWLAAQRGRPVAMLGAPLRTMAADAPHPPRTRDRLQPARRPKEANEPAVLRRAAAATAAGYAQLRSLIRPGVTERALRGEGEAEFCRHRAARAGQFVLADAGGEIDCYGANVTGTYVLGEPTAFQHDLSQVVLAAEERAIARCVPIAGWKNSHLAAAVDMAGGLVAMGVMHGTPESLVAQEAHGPGHSVGLGVRDGSGTLPGRTKDPRASLRTLQRDLPPAAGYVVTAEPGLYCIPALLNDPARRARFRDAVYWPLADQHPDLGGVRIEDNILVTPGAPESLTAAIPTSL